MKYEWWLLDLQNRCRKHVDWVGFNGTDAAHETTECISEDDEIEVREE